MLSINDLIFKACNNYLLENQRRAAPDVNSAINNALSLYVESTYLLDNNTLIWMACNKYLGSTQGDINTAIYAVASSYLSDRGKTVPGDINGAVRDALYIYLGMDAYLYLNFLSNTYRTGGKEYNNFLNIPGATSVGGAGFGMVQRNGVWQTVADGVPLIGDGGLGVYEARTNSIRNPVMAGASVGTPGTFPTGWVVPPQNGLVPKVVGLGTENGLPYIDIQVSGTLTATFFNIQFQSPPTGVLATSGQIFSPSVFVAIKGGTKNITLALNTFMRSAGGSYLGIASPPTALNDVTDDLLKYGRQCIANNASVASVDLAISFGASVGTVVDITLRIAAPNLKLGPDISDPPILQTTGLPATRTAVAQSVGGLSPPSGDWRMQGSVELLGDTGATQRFVDWSAGTDDDKIAVDRNPGGAVLFTSRRAGGSTIVATFNAKAGARFVDFLFEKVGGNLIATCDGVAAAPVAVTPPANMTATQLGAFRGGGGGFLNGYLRNLSLRYD